MCLHYLVRPTSFLAQFASFFVSSLVSFDKAHNHSVFVYDSCIRFSLIRCSHFCVIACQSAMSGMFSNMSLLKTRLPGLLPKPKVVWMLVRMAWVAIDNASSMKLFALVTSCGGSPCGRVCRTFPTV